MFSSFRRLGPWFRAAFRLFSAALPPRRRKRGVMAQKLRVFVGRSPLFCEHRELRRCARRARPPECPLGVGGRCRRFAPCAEAACACPAVGRRPPRARSDRLHAKHPACTVRRCKRGACGHGRKRAAGQKRGPLSPCPPCPPPCGGMTGRNLLPGRPSGPCPSGGSGILAPPKRLRR